MPQPATPPRRRTARPCRPQRLHHAALACAVALLLAACAQSPRTPPARGPISGPDPVGGGDYRRDGPGRLSPEALAGIPDAEPRIEPFRGGTLRPYTVSGRRYVPMTQDAPLRERGQASWYGRQFHGRPTATGERFDMYAMTAAHPTMPLPSYARVRNLGNGREVIVRVNDRGPFRAGRIIDLSYAAAARLDFLREGSTQVEVERLTHTVIADGSWRGGGGTRVAATRAPAAPPAMTAQPAAVPPAPSGAVAAASSASTTPPMDIPTPASPSAMPPASAPATAAGEPVQPAASAGQEAGASATLTALAAPMPGFWLQLGAFRAREGAETFREQVGSVVDWLAPWLSVVEDDPLYRLQAGPYVSREQADEAAHHVRQALQLAPLIVER